MDHSTSLLLGSAILLISFRILGVSLKHTRVKEALRVHHREREGQGARLWREAATKLKHPVTLGLGLFIASGVAPVLLSPADDTTGWLASASWVAAKWGLVMVIIRLVRKYLASALR